MKRFFVILGMLFAGNSMADIADGLVAYFPLDGNAFDESEYQYDGIEYGTVRYATGKVKQAMALDDDGSYVVSSHHLNTYQNLTISFWMYPAEDADMTPYSAACGPDRDAGIAFAYTANKEVVFSVGKGINCSAAAGKASVKKTLDGAGHWYHVVGIYRANESLTLYIDGKKANEIHAVTATVPYLYLSNYQYLGTDLKNPGGPSTWRGDIDEVRVYDRALDDSEVEELYLAAVGNCTAPLPPEVAENLDMHVPLAVYDGPDGPVNLQLDLEFTGDAETGEYTWRLKGYTNVDECGTPEDAGGSQSTN